MKTLLITGASTGIGEATATRFIGEGYRVVNLSRRPCTVVGVTHLACDLADHHFIDVIAPSLSNILSAASEICLIHNAALLENDRVGAMSDERFRRILQVNLLAPSALNNLVMPHLGAGSSILYVGSTLSEKAVANSFSYVTSKHGLVGMMRATCQDLIGSGIHTAMVCPGFTDTAMLRTHLNDDPEVLKAISGMSAYGRLIEPKEIAEALWFCAHNPVINGAVLHANLGQIER